MFMTQHNQFHIGTSLDTIINLDHDHDQYIIVTLIRSIYYSNFNSTRKDYSRSPGVVLAKIIPSCDPVTHRLTYIGISIMT